MAGRPAACVAGPLRLQQRVAVGGVAAGVAQHHGGVAGQFLVGAHVAQRPPGQGVEPVQQAQCAGQQVPGVVAPLPVHGFVAKHQALLQGAEALMEVQRQHQGPGQAQRQGLAPQEPEQAGRHVGAISRARSPSAAS